jgi:hypothetical protein
LSKASSTRFATATQEIGSFVLEVGTFSLYEVANTLANGQQPEDMSWGEWALDVLKSQAWNLLEIKAIGRVLASHKVNGKKAELPQKLRADQELKITPKT